MKFQTIILIAEPISENKNKKCCARGHDPLFNNKIKYSRKRFCTCIIGTLHFPGRIQTIMCGDIEIGEQYPEGMVSYEGFSI